MPVSGLLLSQMPAGMTNLGYGPEILRGQGFPRAFITST